MTTPEGVNNKLYDPTGLETNSVLTIVSSIFAGITVVIVGARIYTQAVVKRSLRVEDYVAGAALVLVIAATGVACAADQRAGLGLDFDSATVSDFIMWFKLLWVYNFLYPFTISLIRVSILLQIRRIALGTCQGLLHKASTLLLCLTPFYLLAMMLIQLLQCKPISAWWDPYASVNQCGGANRTHAEYSAIAFFSAIADLLLLGLGVWAVSGRRRISEPGRLVGLGAIAFLAIGAIALTFFRFGLWERINNHDVTINNVWDSIIYTFWIPPQLETTFLLTATSLPALEALLSPAPQGGKLSHNSGSMQSPPDTGFSRGATSMEMFHPGKAQHSVVVTASRADNVSEHTVVDSV